jgi:ribosomal protein S18 acetylase RimI-like enzyme
MVEVFFSKAETHDIDNLISIWSSYPHDGLDPGYQRSRYISELTEKDNRVIFIARDHKDYVAYVHLILQRADNDPEMANGATIAHVHDLRVNFARQAEGIGSLCMDFLEKQAARMGFKILTLGVDSPNEKAIGLYTKLGYIRFKEIQGRNLDERCYYMRKSLAQSV